MAQADPIKKRRQAEFLEDARGLVQTDRFNREHQVNQDFAKAIARALEAAYQKGLKEAFEPPAEPTQNEYYVDWIEIPSRSRNALDRICFSAVLFSEEAEDLSKSVLRWWEGGYGEKACWLDLAHKDSTWGRTTIAPLVRLGLLIEASEHEGHLFLSGKGILTYLIHMETERHFYEYVSKFYASDHGSKFKNAVMNILSEI